MLSLKLSNLFLFSLFICWCLSQANAQVIIRNTYLDLYVLYFIDACPGKKLFFKNRFRYTTLCWYWLWSLTRYQTSVHSTLLTLLVPVFICKQNNFYSLFPISPCLTKKITILVIEYPPFLMPSLFECSTKLIK